MSKKFSLCKDCSGLALKSIGIVIAIVQALTMHTKWKWLTITLTCIAISSPDCVAIYKIAAMLLANIKYKQSACFDYFERCLCCAATLAGACITTLAITGYTLCSVGTIYCPNAVLWALIATATITIPAIYVLTHCKYHNKFALHMAKRLIESNTKKTDDDLDKATIRKPSNYTIQMLAKYQYSQVLNEEINAINDYIEASQHSDELKNRVITHEEKSNAALSSTQKMLTQLMTTTTQEENNDTSQKNLVTEIQQDHYKIMRNIYGMRALFCEIANIKKQIHETSSFIQVAPQAAPS
ncbi:MAG: hypothetical protein KAS93_04300 [Gammaproteobacteria bacterium]|nr:hypothetical protein [Gammaproteobacteria bacterium]